MPLPWNRNKPPPPALVEDDKINLKLLSPALAGILKTCLGKIDPSNLGKVELEQVHTLHSALQGPQYSILSKGLFDDYAAPVEALKALPQNPKRK